LLDRIPQNKTSIPPVERAEYTYMKYKLGSIVVYKDYHKPRGYISEITDNIVEVITFSDLQPHRYSYIFFDIYCDVVSDGET
jgi:hypothetical protein